MQVKRRPKPEGVTPLAGVWVEIKPGFTVCETKDVTPLAGVWVEIECEVRIAQTQIASLPLRECGLKSDDNITVWHRVCCHSPCGSVG